MYNYCSIITVSYSIRNNSVTSRDVRNIVILFLFGFCEVFEEKNSDSVRNKCQFTANITALLCYVECTMHTRPNDVTHNVTTSRPK